MTAFTMPSSTKTQPPLRAAAAALQAAQDGLDSGDHTATREALVALARTSYQSLSAFDEETGKPPAAWACLRDRLAWWHQQLDDARVQVALAEMDTREVREELLEGVERRLEPVADAVATAVSDITSALAGLRKELRDLQSRLPEQ